MKIILLDLDGTALSLNLKQGGYYNNATAMES